MSEMGGLPEAEFEVDGMRLTARIDAEAMVERGVLVVGTTFAFVTVNGTTYAAPISDRDADRPEFGMSPEVFAAYARSVEKELEHFDALYHSGALDAAERWLD